MWLVQTSSDTKLASSLLRIVYAFIIASLAVLLCGVSSLCSSVICYELLLLKNAFYIAIYAIGLCFLAIFFLHIYSNRHRNNNSEKLKNKGEVILSTMSSFQHHSLQEPDPITQSGTLTERNNDQAPPRPPRHHIPVGAHALPGMATPTITQNGQQQSNLFTAHPFSRINGLLSSFRGRDRVWPVLSSTPGVITQINQESSAVAAKDVEIAKPSNAHQQPKIIGKMKALDKLFVLPEASNLILKLFVIALSFPAMLYSIFRLAVAAERYSPQYNRTAASSCLIPQIEIVQFGLLIFLIPTQAFFAFKYGRVFSHQSPMLAAFALIHLLATNFATWFEMFTVETSRFHFRTRSAVFDYYPINVTHSNTNKIADDHSTSYSFCFDSSTTIRRAATEAAPFLYPLFTHYLLLVSISLLRLLFAYCTEQHTNEEEIYMTSNTPSLHGSGISTMFDGPCDCRHSNKGIFVNLFVIVAVTSLILAAHFLSPTVEEQKGKVSSGNPARSATVRLAYYTAQIAINSVIILAVPIAWRGLSRLDRVPHRDSSYSQYNVSRALIAIGCLGFVIIYYLAIIIAHSASLAQLVINYFLKGGSHHAAPLSSSSSANHLPIRTDPLTSNAATTFNVTTTHGPITPTHASSAQTGMFFLICPGGGSTNAHATESHGDSSAYAEANLTLSHSPTITIPAIVASALAIGRAVSCILLAVCQVVLALLGDCRSALTEKQLDKKPGRALVMFILTASLIGWALEIAFELHTSSIGDSVATFHSLSPSLVDIGHLIWPLFAVFTIPLMVGYRLCISIWLYDNWLKCYSPTII